MAELYNFQRQTVDALLAGKHIVVADCGCLAKGTPIKMADGTYKKVENISSGEKVLGYDEYDKCFAPSEVHSVFRTSHKPKPMIELEYDGETIKTTYDHPFYNGEGFYPLYQLIWGALETSQRVQLKLLCEQYGQTFDYKKTKCKHSCCDETCERCLRLLQNNNEREDSKSTPDSGAKLAKKPERIALCKPHKRGQGRQQGREPRVVLYEVQRMVGDEDRQYQATDKASEYSAHEGGERVGARTISKTISKCGKNLGGELAKSEILRRDMPKVSRYIEGNYQRVGFTRIKVLQAEPYYSLSLRTAPHTYCIGRKHSFIVHNTGKNPMSMVWAAEKCKQTGKDKILVITTASKAKTSDSLDDMDAFCPNFRKSISSFQVISWHKLARWVNENWSTLEEWVIVADEVARAKGYTTGMGRAFIKIAKRNSDWSGWTATPGDSWDSFISYFVACGLVRTKTLFMAKYAIVQTYKGYPEIIGWVKEDELKKMWAQISYAPDTSSVRAELPAETYKTTTFAKPTGYNQVIKTRLNSAGEFIETAGGLVAELRRLCFTKDKQEWLSDFVEGLGSGLVLFYNYISTGDKLEEIIKKALPKGARVWRIDGTHHEIPTAKTFGKRDVVICQWQSGSEALNLQFIAYMVIVELCYSYSTFTQGLGRIKRIGQKNPMFFYLLLTKGTIEQDVLACLREKREFSERNWCIGNNLIKEKEDNNG